MKELLLIGDPVQIYMVERQSSRILARDRVRRARDRLLHSKAACDTLRKGRLAGGERAFEQDDRPPAQTRSNAFTECSRFL